MIKVKTFTNVLKIFNTMNELAALDDQVNEFIQKNRIGRVISVSDYKKEMHMEEKVRLALDEVRPGLQADGGDVELVEVTDDGIVKVKLKGACAGCPMSQMTLKQGIEKYLMEKIPEVKSVVSA